MPRFSVTVINREAITYEVEALDEHHAREIYSAGHEVHAEYLDDQEVESVTEIDS